MMLCMVAQVIVVDRPQCLKPACLPIPFTPWSKLGKEILRVRLCFLCVKMGG